MIAGAWVFLSVCAAATLLAGRSRNRVSVRVSIVLGAGLRIWFAVLTSRQLTPRDTRVYFHDTGELVLHGHDPLHDLPGRAWNFLELMPYIHAIELRSGLPWVYALKIAPIWC